MQIVNPDTEVSVAPFEPVQSGNMPPDSVAAFPWYGVRVKSRFEFVTARLLRQKGFEEFLPLYRSKRVWSDRVKELDVPLFPGYVFCRFDTGRLLEVLTTAGVVHVISVGRQPIPVEKTEMDAVRSICVSGLTARPWPFLESGRRVLVEKGPLAGIEGRVISAKGEWRLVVSVSLLQRAVSTEIDREWIRPI